MESKVFVESIKACRRRLNIAELYKCLVFALGIGVGAGILFQAAAFVLPFYYANLYTALAIFLAVIAAFGAAYAKRKSMKQTALFMDSFGFQERIVTAFEHLNEDGELLRLQREDAIKQLELHKERIRIPLMPSKKKLAWVIGMFVLMLGMSLIPSAVKERAKELHQVQTEAKEKEKEIQEVLEGMEELAREELTPEQLAALQEMMESLESSMAEYQQANSSEMLAAAGEKLNYKYENMSSQLTTLAQSLQNGAAASMATAESMQAMAEQMQQMQENNALGSNAAGNQQLASNQNQSGQPQNGKNSQNGQNGNVQNGNGQNGSQGGNGQNGSQGGNNGTGSNQNGNGQSGSQGNGSGNGQNGGQGSGNGFGNGRGNGSSSAPHDYVSIPNAIIDSGNLTGNAQNHYNSEYFRTQNGLNWEGTHVSHEAVIGSYEQKAYEGIAAGKYPSGMEDVIKDYFSSFN